MIMSRKNQKIAVIHKYNPSTTSYFVFCAVMSNCKHKMKLNEEMSFTRMPNPHSINVNEATSLIGLPYPDIYFVLSVCLSVSLLLTTAESFSFTIQRAER